MPVKKEYEIRKNWKFSYGSIGDPEKPDDPNYVKDKREVFDKNGNGWWIYVGVASTHTPDDYKTGYDG